MALAQHKFQSGNISVLPHQETKCERPPNLVWTHMSEDNTRKTLETDFPEKVRTITISERMAEHSGNVLWKKHYAKLGNITPWNPQVIQPPRPNKLMVEKTTGSHGGAARQPNNPTLEKMLKSRPATWNAAAISGAVENPAAKGTNPLNTSDLYLCHFRDNPKIHKV